MNQNIFEQEFREFSEAERIQPPENITRQIFQVVHDDLNPPAWQVFSKLTLIHAIVGTLTLLVCPQFGFEPLADIGLMEIFMTYGHFACKLACGAVYLGSSALAASLLLSVEETQVLRRTEALQLPLLGLLSIAAFICFGATAVFSALTVAWLLGSVLGGLATLELGWLVRRGLRALG